MNSVDIIQFSPSGRPSQINSICAQCIELCKQHKLVQLIVCPSFKATQKPLTKKSPYPSLEKDAETSSSGRASHEVHADLPTKQSMTSNSLKNEVFYGNV